MTREEAKALADRVLALSKGADQTRVNITSNWSGNTRFADASITTSGGITDVVVEVTVTIGRRRASASTNVLDDASLRRTVDLAAQLARLSPDDPELMPELGPQNHATVNAYIEDTANLTPAARAGAVRRTIDGTGGGQIFSAGFLDAHADRRRGRDQQRPVCVSPDDRRRPVDDGENAGRHGQRLGQRRLARLGQDRPCGDRPRGRAKGRIEPQPAGDRRAADDRRARAAGRERSRSAALGLAERARGRRRPQRIFESRAAARESARR